MTGHLTLPTGPAAANAVRKDYVDAADALKVSKAGDTMTGVLSVIPPTGSAFIIMSPTAAAQQAGISFQQGGVNKWSFGKYTDDSFMFYDQVAAAFVMTFPSNGTTINVTRAVVLPADPTSNLHAATKQYVDGKVVAPATVAPVMDGAAAVGVAVKYAREDHVHPTDTSRAAASAIPVAATAAEYLQGNAAKFLTGGAVWTAAVPVALVDGATVTPDFAAGLDFTWTLGAVGRTLANPTNIKAGQKGMIYLKQDATGSRTITSWGTFYKFAGGTKPTLSTAANANDTLTYAVKSSTEIHCSFLAAMA
jgi:hypothetical protein